jgi:Zn-dependent M16 (insulinase) family peptidase
LTYTTKDDLNEHTLELDIGSQCLNRNLPAMFSLLEALAVPCGVRWHDEPDRMKELLTRRAAALSSAVAPQVPAFLSAPLRLRLGCRYQAARAAQPCLPT